MSENLTRALSGIVYIVLLIGATLYSELSFQLLFAFFLVFSIYEFAKLTKLPLLASYAAGILITAPFFAYKNELSFDLLNYISIAVLLFLLITLFSKKKIVLSYPMRYVLLLGYAIIPFLAIMRLPYLEATYEPRIIIGLFILIWTNDTFAYIVGKKFGKNKLFERISPKKTIEGFLGGLAFAIVFGAILSQFFTFFSIAIWISSAIFVSFFGTVGDLVESKFKREAAVKDSGAIMPGHGGILDRLDSVIFVVPFLYLIFQTFK